MIHSAFDFNGWRKGVDHSAIYNNLSVLALPNLPKYPSTFESKQLADKSKQLSEADRAKRESLNNLLSTPVSSLGISDKPKLSPEDQDKQSTLNALLVMPLDLFLSYANKNDRGAK